MTPADISTITAPMQFLWTDFYEAVAKRLLTYERNRATLIEGLHDIGSRVPGLAYLQDKFPDGSSGPLRDICPFTAMGVFNRTMTDDNRKLIAREFANLLGVSVPVPASFEAIPVLNNQRSWFFTSSDKRGPNDIEKLWAVFVAANELLRDDQPAVRDAFIEAYDSVTKVWGVAWNLSTGLYWAHPWKFATLDRQSREYITQRLGISIVTSGQQGPCNARSYLALLDRLRTRFEDDDCPVQSFPELSFAAVAHKSNRDENAAPGVRPDRPYRDPRPESGNLKPPRSVESGTDYTIDEILSDGCFLVRDEVARMLQRLESKKNLILQGPPGTGKTWLAKRLAFALIGRRDHAKVRAVQFHPNLSYEDFVRGWRPSGDGRLTLADGVFMESIRAALAEPESRFVVVIEEINRGNPAQIFGELLTLLEAGKRSDSDALELGYPDPDGVRRRVHIPENLYVVGTMNIADRSLALVDLALRRRFAFVSLEPTMGAAWRDWVVKERAVDPRLVPQIEHRITMLNEQIEADTRLGRQFKIGHSYVTPTGRLAVGGTRDWFRQVVETEIAPLLDEYWFDAPDEVRSACARLLQDW